MAGKLREGARSAWRHLTETARHLPRWLRQALRGRGRERETLMVIVKGTLAASLAWALAETLLDSPNVAFAPFSALVVVYPSIYRSVLQSGRYVAAVFGGALLAGAAGLGFGLNVWSFALAVGVAMILGRLGVLGVQGPQLPIITAFALAGGNATRLADLGTLLAMACVGAGVALLVNVLLAPTVRFRDAGSAVLALASELGRLLRDMAEGLERGWEGADTEQWYARSSAFEDTISNAEAAVAREEQRIRFNPWHRGLPKTLPGYRGWIATLSRAAAHTQSISRSLRDATRESEPHSVPSDEFLRHYAHVVALGADVVNLVRELDEPNRTSTSDELREGVEEGFREISALMARVREQRFGGVERWPVYGALLTDTERFFEELYEGHTHGRPEESHDPGR